MGLLHFAEFLTPNIMVPDSTTRSLTGRTVQEALAVAPESAYCFRFFDRTDEPAPVTPGYTQIPLKLNQDQGWHYIGGTVYSLEKIQDLAAEDPSFRSLHANAKMGQWPAVINCRTGNWLPFNVEDVYVPSPAPIYATVSGESET